MVGAKPRAEAGGIEPALTSEAERTTARIDALERDLTALREATADSPDDEHDPEGATIAFERQQVAALLASAKKRLGELEEGRERLRSGDYGFCADCGGAIPMERMLAIPAVRRCTTCATRADGG
ncbi:MAG: TraR/DksA family transcriptional regulator [Egicoccus sp.]